MTSGAVVQAIDRLAAMTMSGRTDFTKVLYGVHPRSSVGSTAKFEDGGDGRVPLYAAQWWAHLEFTRINITPTILPKKFEDLRQLGAFIPVDPVRE
jgi:hypothetical protein